MLILKFKNEHLAFKTPSINMNLTPNKNSPKEKRSFTFFRSRTLSSSSAESNNGLSTSPRISPRSLLDKVRKRSQSDAKSQQPIVETITDRSNPQQQQVLIKKLNGASPLSIGPSSPRRHVSLSISEESELQFDASISPTTRLKVSDF